MFEVIDKNFDIEISELKKVSARYPFLITSFLRDRIENGTYSKEAARQFVPDLLELDNHDGYAVDPCNERKNQKTRAVIHRYDNRVALILTQRCLVYCRFCFRKDFVGHDDTTIGDDALDDALNYIKSDTKARDILLTGGDPLVIPNSRLIPFLEKLASIDHVKVIRIDSRALNAFPRRLDDDFLSFCESKRVFWYHAHINHPDDINDPSVLDAVNKMLKAGIPVMNQCVILRGVNDDAEIITELMMNCYENKVIPYNMYVLDKVKGAHHFAVSKERIMKIYESVGTLPGPAQPALVLVNKENVKQRVLFNKTIDIESFLNLGS